MSSRTGLTASELGCRVLYPDAESQHANSTVDIVAVPGLGAHADFTWTSKIGVHVHWLKDADMLPAVVPNARIMRFGYESAWIGDQSINQRLSLLGEQLLRGLELQRLDCRARPIVFIVHSMGGNVLQKALITAKLCFNEPFGDILKSTAGIISLGTPFRGSRTAEIAQIFSAIVDICTETNTNLIREIRDGSESLKDMLYDFCNVLNTESIPLFCFFEQRKTDISQIAKRKFNLIPAHSQIMVDELSACVDGFAKLGLASDHLRMNKFQSPQDNNFRLVAQGIKRFVDQATGHVKARLNPRKLVQDDSLVETENRECLHALFVTNPLDDMQRLQTTKNELLEESCSWIFSSMAYTNWLNNQQSQTLWIHGSAGKGKTFITIAIIEELLKRLTHSNNSDSILAYFFCDNKDYRLNNAVAILRAILYQILCRQPNLFPYIQSEYQKQKSQLFTSTNALQTLWRILQTMMLQSSKGVFYIVIDALDECDLVSRRVLLNLMKKPMSGSGTVVKWILTSRDEVDIRGELMESLSISLEANSDSVSRAVQKFIAEKVKELSTKKRYNQKLQAEVRESLKSKAEGTFLWVSLACAELDRTPATEKRIRQALDKLPTGLEAIYAQILDRALGDDPPEEESDTKEILKAVIVAIRPLSLSELAVAAGLPEECWYDRDSVRPYVDLCGSFLYVGDRLVRRNMREYMKTTVNLVHQSAKDFLISRSGKLELSEELVKENGALASKCLSYICRSVSADGPMNPETYESQSEGNQWYLELEGSQSYSESEGSQPYLEQEGCESYSEPDGSQSYSESEGSQPYLEQEGCESYSEPSNDEHSEREGEKLLYLEYPMEYWISHGRLAPAMAGDILDANREFFAPISKARALWWRVHAEKRHVSILYLPNQDSKGSALDVAAYSGIAALVKKVLDLNSRRYIERVDSHIDAGDSLGSGAALILAAFQGHKEVTEMLLNHGADIEAENETGRTALMWSSYSQHQAVMQVLLDRKAIVNKMHKDGQTALSWASRSGNEAIVQLLLQHGANVEPTEENAVVPVIEAASGNRPATVQLLLDWNASIDGTDRLGQTALMRASSLGYDAVVGLLLSRGADPLKRDNEGRTALIDAVKSYPGTEKVVSQLLKTEIGVDAQDCEGATALMHAANYAYVEVAQMLITAEADVNKIDNQGRNALFYAVVCPRILRHWMTLLDREKIRECLVQLLLKHGISLHSTDMRGYNVLFYAVIVGDEYMVRFLLNAGAYLEQQPATRGDALSNLCLVTWEYNRRAIERRRDRFLVPIAEEEIDILDRTVEEEFGELMHRLPGHDCLGGNVDSLFEFAGRPVWLSQIYTYDEFSVQLKSYMRIFELLLKARERKAVENVENARTRRLKRSSSI